MIFSELFLLGLRPLFLVLCRFPDINSRPVLISNEFSHVLGAILIIASILVGTTQACRHRRGKNDAMFFASMPWTHYILNI